MEEEEEEEGAWEGGGGGGGEGTRLTIHNGTNSLGIVQTVKISEVQESSGCVFGV